MVLLWVMFIYIIFEAGELKEAKLRGNVYFSWFLFRGSKRNSTGFCTKQTKPCNKFVVAWPIYLNILSVG